MLVDDGVEVEVDLDEFLLDNEFSKEEVAEITALLPGETYYGGGGAWAEWRLMRLG